MTRSSHTAAPSPAAQADGTALGLYALIVAVWGSSWILIRYTLGPAQVEFTLALRFGLAASMMWSVLAVRGRLRETWTLGTARDHAWMALTGAFLFSANFILFFYAGERLPTGLLAVVFSLATLLNMALSSAFEGSRVSGRVWLGGVIGVSGLALVFSPELSGGEGALTGLLLAALGTLSFSCGNLAAQRLRMRGLPLVPSAAWGMVYGTLWLGLAALVHAGLAGGMPLDARPAYWISLVLQSVFASVVAFLTYLSLLRRIGTARAGYATVMFPLVALGWSTWLEGYQWAPIGLAGLALMMLGNVFVLRGAR